MSFIWRKFEGCSKCAMSTVTGVILFSRWLIILLTVVGSKIVVFPRVHELSL